MCVVLSKCVAMCVCVAAQSVSSPDGEGKGCHICTFRLTHYCAYHIGMSFCTMSIPTIFDLYTTAIYIGLLARVARLLVVHSCSFTVIM